MAQPSIEPLDNCWFCAGSTYINRTFTSGQSVAFVECVQCLARGPIVMMSRPDWEAQVRAAWAAGKKFGRIAVAAVPGGMPSFTCSLAERVRLIAEGLYKGEYGEAESAVIVFKVGIQAITITHNISNSDVVRVLTAVRDSSRIRAATVTIPNQRGQDNGR